MASSISTTHRHHHHSGGIGYSPLHAKGPGTSNSKGGSKWRNCFHITPTKPDGTYWLTVRLNNKRLGVDRASVQDASAALEQFLQEHKKEYRDSNQTPSTKDPTFVYRYRLCANVELAENQLTSSGCIVMLNTLAHHNVQCKALRLYRNFIDDVAVCRLSQMLAEQSEAIEELHLSNNRITERGIMQLLMTFALHPNEAYPWQAKSQIYQPTWLRMENNNVSKPQEMLRILVDTGKLILCVADDKSGCGPSKCVNAYKERKTSPIAHLHMYDVHPNASSQAALTTEEMVRIASCKSYDEIQKLPPARAGPVMSMSGHALPHAASSTLSAFIGNSSATSPPPHGASQAAGKKAASGYSTNSTSATSTAAGTAVKGAWPSASRPSGPASDTVIHRYQLVNLPAPNDCSEEADLSHCICGRCQNVLKDPIQTRPCRHRFCRTCFQAHMERFTIPAKQKNKPVTSIPCPSCGHGLARSDVGCLDEKTLREYRQTRVRCKHHPVNFLSPLYLAEKAAAASKDSSGADGEDECSPKGDSVGPKHSSGDTVTSSNPPSELVKTALGIECRWQGSISEYAAHIHQCQVEEIVRDQMAPRADFASVVRNTSAISATSGAATFVTGNSSASLVSPSAREKVLSPKSDHSIARKQQQQHVDITSDSTTTAATRTEPLPTALTALPMGPGIAEAAASIAAAVEGQLKSSAPKVYEAMAMESNDTPLLPGGLTPSLVESGTLPRPPSDWSPTSRTSRMSKPSVTPLSRMGDNLEDTIDRKQQQQQGSTYDFLDQLPLAGGLGSFRPPLPQENMDDHYQQQPHHHQLMHQEQQHQAAYGPAIPTAMHGKGFYYEQSPETERFMGGHHHPPIPPYHMQQQQQQQQHREYNHYPDRMPYAYDHPMAHHHQPVFDSSMHHYNNGHVPPLAPQHSHAGYGDEASRRRREFEAIAAATTAAHSSQYPRPGPPQQEYQQQQGTAPAAEGDTRAVNEYRRIVHDYVPDPETMSLGNNDNFLDLCAGDVVRVLEVTASGWAAGMRVDEDWRDIPHPQTGSTAWFPYSFSVAIER